VAVDRHGLGQHSYSGTVISYLPVPKMKQPINNLEDLARSEDVGLILLADTVIEQQIKVSPFCYASSICVNSEKLCVNFTRMPKPVHSKFLVTKFGATQIE
jgi:hypothetical protein